MHQSIVTILTNNNKSTKCYLLGELFKFYLFKKTTIKVVHTIQLFMVNPNETIFLSKSDQENLSSSLYNNSTYI